jgi:TctA family transporter
MSADPKAFGRGAIEGVIGPEGSNNSKEGGALVTTLALGIPGSAGMAVLLGGFVLLGLEPGPRFLADHMDLAVGLAIVLAVANLLAVAIMIGASPALARIAEMRPRLLAPILVVLVVLGAYATHNEPLDVVATFAIGLLGCAMKALGYSRAAFVLGFVMAPLIETYLHISLQVYGAAFLLRPGALLLITMIALGLFWGHLRRRVFAAATRQARKGHGKD